MGKYTFLFKENDTDDRDCVRYVNIGDLRNGHVRIDGRFNVRGSCYSKSLKAEDAFYDDITTVLTEEEYALLCDYDGSDLAPIIAKLESEENDALFEQVQREEAEWLIDEYNLDEDDVERIFDEYYPDYRDRGVVSYVYEDAEDLAYETVDSWGMFDNYEDTISRYFDYAAFGEDLAGEENYVELKDGRVVALNY